MLRFSTLALFLLLLSGCLSSEDGGQSDRRDNGADPDGAAADLVPDARDAVAAPDDRANEPDAVDMPVEDVTDVADEPPVSDSTAEAGPDSGGADVADSDVAGDESDSCRGGLAASGTVSTTISDLDYSAGEVDAHFQHKLDVDPQEDRCIAALTATLSVFDGKCPLTFHFGTFDDNVGGLLEVEFEADSFCAGFEDQDEGLYRSRSDRFAPVWFDGPNEVSGRMVEYECLVDVDIQFDSTPIPLYREGDTEPLLLSLAGLTLRGDIESAGNTTLACPEVGVCSTDMRDPGNGLCAPTNSGCIEGFHEGGDGGCLPEGECAPEHHDGGAGVCVATGTCSPGYREGGDSTCVEVGGCSEGYHDRGEGVCVAVGTCSGGYHDGGEGDCVLVASCSEGYHDGGKGDCVGDGTCSDGYHDGGPGRCVEVGSCSSGYYDPGSGECLPNGECEAGFEWIDDCGAACDPGVCVRSENLAGPNVFTGSWTSASPAGIHFRAIEDVLLVSFEFHNLGLSDTVVLEELGGRELLRRNTPSGAENHTIVANISLAADQSYRIYALGNSPRNIKYKHAPGFQQQNQHVSVFEGYHPNHVDANSRGGISYRWFGFRYLKTRATPD